MNKFELVHEVAKVVNSKNNANSAIECILTTISKALKEGDVVSIAGFGTFKTTIRKARKGRNPQTGEEIYIESKKVLKFVPGKALKDAIS